MHRRRGLPQLAGQIGTLSPRCDAGQRLAHVERLLERRLRHVVVRTVDVSIVIPLCGMPFHYHLVYIPYQAFVKVREVGSYWMLIRPAKPSS